MMYPGAHWGTSDAASNFPRWMDSFCDRWAGSPCPPAYVCMDNATQGVLLTGENAGELANFASLATTTQKGRQMPKLSAK